MLLVLIAYCFLLLLVGAWAARSVHRAGDFFVASRSLSPALLGATLLAANLGAGSTVGAAEFGYTSGLPAWWWVGSAGIGSLALAFVVGPRVWRIAEARNLYTVGDYLEGRYGAATRRVAAVILLCGAPAILAGQIIAVGLVLRVATGLPEIWGTLLGGAIATLYFAMGGLRSAAWVNTLQVAVKIAGFLVAVPWMVRASGGWPAIAAAAPGEHALSVGGASAGETFQLFLMLAPAFIVSPGLVQKLYGARDERAVRLGVGLQGAALLGYSFLPVLLGMVARIHFPELEEPGMALIKLFDEAAPLWLGSLMLAAIFSAEVSSADAVLFMITTSVVRDLIEPLSSKQVTDAALLSLARRAAVAAGAAGILLAHWFQSILTALSFFYSLLTITLFVPLVAGLFWRRPGQGTALAAMGASLAAAAMAQLAPTSIGSWAGPVPAGIAAASAVFAAAAFSPPRQQPV